MLYFMEGNAMVSLIVFFNKTNSEPGGHTHNLGITRCRTEKVPFKMYK